MSLTSFLIGVVTGLGLGAVYVLVAMSFTLVLAVSGVFNFLQSTYVMLGTVGTFALGVTLGYPTFVVVAILIAAGMLAGLLTEVLAVHTTLERAQGHFSAVMALLGIGLAAETLTGRLFGLDVRVVPSYVSTTPLTVGDIPVRPVYLVTVGVTVLIVAVFELVMNRTELGTVLRAALDDPEGARLTGINTRVVIAAVFAVAGALATLTGFLVSPITLASPFVAAPIGLLGFAAMGIGGFGSFKGALIGGVMVGLIQGIAPVMFDSHATMPIVWLTVVLVLVVKPTGLFGKAGSFGTEKLREL